MDVEPAAVMVPVFQVPETEKLKREAREVEFPKEYTTMLRLKEPAPLDVALNEIACATSISDKNISPGTNILFKNNELDRAVLIPREVTEVTTTISCIGVSWVTESLGIRNDMIISSYTMTY
jgi:hypothetical protein